MPFQVRLGTTSTIATNGNGNEGTTMITFPISSTYKTTSETIVDSARNSGGYIVSSVVRPCVKKIELTWRVMTIVDYAKLATFFNGHFTFFAYFFDTDSNAWITKEMYVGNRIADALKNEQWKTTSRGGGVEPNHVENFKISLIEV